MTDETKTLALELKWSADAETSGAFEGLAAGYGNVDHGGDVFAPGAFADSLNEHKSAGTRPALLWQHDPAEPIGVIDALTETAAGLSIKGRLAIDTQKGREAYSLAKMGAVSGLSVGYRTKRASRSAKGVREIKSAHLGEVSLVTVPMNDRARLTSVKTAATAKGKSMTDIDTDATELAELKSKIADLEAKGAKVDNIEAELKKALDRADALELKMNRPGAARVSKDELADLQKKSFNAFLRGGVGALGDNERKSLGLEGKSMTVGDPNASVFAPPEFASEIIRNLVQFSPVRTAARVMSIGAAEVKIPRRTGNLTAAWVTETGARSGSDATYDNVTVAPGELACYVDVSNQLLEDSAYDIASEVSYDLGEEFGRAEGAAFVSGDGVNKPKGILTDTNIAKVKAGSTTAITADALVSFFYKLPSPYANNAVWMMNRNTIGVIRNFKDTTGRFLWVDSLQVGAPPQLLGRPVIEAPDMPDIAASALPIVLGDFFQGYRIVDRVSLALLRDPFTQATSGLTRFHARRRVGGQVVKPEAFRTLQMAT
ncbi:phage prohead protease, HK97 family/phage major capsid protein, HK97 family,TIGR01554 [Rhodoblastus acidophilus]|uniref:Phage prohead protease, HK97 family/phage major capsid protein, HK97 family,TIGR01554 n=1 Tax=Rhodoblastus acidophilus TaxID=1074 RepID=A0A212R0H2_RHOAC|nr:phage major capsid protein [Rhodoblastus acidophilus]PPQ40462.1 phage major capsid protein [Rhodoblastus acidophilus]RAI23054.1 phage major capsid protein [Rhodoblastus acidophilus]SNB65486.1 phage prohead protease, HK97 family/phage major capsid protein, HK97 family,TIGR01554 [Rhodoblastus acidophilus]